ncbi:iron ABC transporter permease [Halobacteriales archaeon QS_8_69_26]|nr:MAG: iron ABC transporter permease [Halobacteriales archaeon QS_8_69_26]
MFYFPVGLVLHEAVVVGGRLSAASFVEVLTDPFYFGVLADVFADPLAVDRHIRALGGWIDASIRPLGPGHYVEAVLNAVRHPLDPARHLRALWSWLVPGVPFRLGLFGFTAYQAALSTVASVAIGLPGAWVLSRFEFPGRRTLRSLTILPFVLPGIMVAIGFFAMFSRGGFFNDALAVLGLGRLELVGTLEVVVLAHAFYNAPLVTRLTTAAWEAVDARTVETARSLGAGPRRAFRDVVVPQLLPAVLTGALLTFIFTFMTFPIVLALGGLELATVEVWIYDRIRRLEVGEAATLAVLETAASIGLTYAYLRYEARTAGGRAANPPEREPLVPSLRSLATPRRLAILAYGLLVVVLFLGPLASMVVESFTVDDRFTLRHYEFLIQRQTEGASFETKPLPAIRNSLVYAVATLVVALPIGVVVAVLSTDHGPGVRSRWRTVLESLSLLPLAVSGIVVGVGLLLGPVFGVSLPGGYRLTVTGPVAVVAAHAVAAYPFVVRNVAPLLSNLDRAMVESARALGASRARALVDVELPLVYSGVLAGAVFAFAISVGEFDSTVILATGTGSYTMPVAVERFLGRRSGPALAMGTVLLLVTSVSFVVIDRVGGRIGGRGL